MTGQKDRGIPETFFDITETNHEEIRPFNHSHTVLQVLLYCSVGHMSVKGQKQNLAAMRLSLYSHQMTSMKVTSPGGKKNRNPAEFPILATLLAGPQHGYEMCRTLGESLGSTWRLGKSQIYALLAKMEREGLVCHDRVGQENLPAKNIFSLTPKGRQIVDDWLQEPVHNIRHIRLEFVAKLWFLRKFHPHQERHLIEKQLAACKTKAMVLERLSTSCRGEVEALSIDFRLTAARAAISWLKRLPHPPEIGVHAEGD